MHHLVKVLKDKNLSGIVRSTAAHFLGKLGDPRAIQPLTQLVQNEKTFDFQVRELAVASIGKIRSEESTSILIQFLNQTRAEIRKAAAEALGKRRDPQAAEPLIHALNDSVWYVRQSAANALWKIGDTRAIDPLVARFKSENEIPGVFLNAIRQFTLIHPDAVLAIPINDRHQLEQDFIRRRIEEMEHKLC